MSLPYQIKPWCTSHGTTLCVRTGFFNYLSNYPHCKSKGQGRCERERATLTRGESSGGEIHQEKGSCRESKTLRLESNCVKSEQSPLASLGLKLHLTAVERRRISPDSSRALSLYTFKNMAPQSHYPRLWRCKSSVSTSHSTAQRGCVASPRSVQNPKKIKK